MANQQFFAIVEMAHLQAFDEVLATNLLKRPTEILRMVISFCKPSPHSSVVVGK